MIKWAETKTGKAQAEPNGSRSRPTRSDSVFFIFSQQQQENCWRVSHLGPHRLSSCSHSSSAQSCRRALWTLFLKKKYTRSHYRHYQQFQCTKLFLLGWQLLQQFVVVVSLQVMSAKQHNNKLMAELMWDTKAFKPNGYKVSCLYLEFLGLNVSPFDRQCFAQLAFPLLTTFNHYCHFLSGIESIS